MNGPFHQLHEEAVCWAFPNSPGDNYYPNLSENLQGQPPLLVLRGLLLHLVDNHSQAGPTVPAPLHPAVIAALVLACRNFGILIERF